MRTGRRAAADAVLCAARAARMQAHDEVRHLHRAGEEGPGGSGQPGFLMCRASHVSKPAAVEEQDEEKRVEELAAELSVEIDRMGAVADAVLGPQQ